MESRYFCFAAKLSLIQWRIPVETTVTRVIAFAACAALLVSSPSAFGQAIGNFGDPNAPKGPAGIPHVMVMTTYSTINPQGFSSLVVGNYEDRDKCITAGRSRYGEG